MNLAHDFDSDSFMEQGFRFTRITELASTVEVLESWTADKETWVDIGRVMESKDKKSWAAIAGPFIRIGFHNRYRAAQYLERAYYGN